MDRKQKSAPNPWIAILISGASLLISGAAFLVSSTSSYFTHFYSSETLYATLLYLGPLRVEEKPFMQELDLTIMEANIVLVNGGNRNVIVSNVELSFWPEKKPEDMSGQVRIPEFTSSVFLEPGQAYQFQTRFTFDGIPEERRSPPEETEEGVYEDYPVIFVFTTIGSSGKQEVWVLEAGSVTLRNRKYDMHSNIEPRPIKVRN